MTEAARIYGSLRNRLMVSLIAGAALLAVLLFLLVRGYATQIAQQAQDAILSASVTSILDAALIREGRVEIDIPYAAFSMLTTPSDDRVFYAIEAGGAVLSGYDDLAPPDATHPPFETIDFQGATLRRATARRVLIAQDQPTRITVTVAQTQDAMAGTLARISRNAALFGAGFFALATLLAYWASATTIGQLNALGTSVARRGPQDLSPFAAQVPREMAPLVTSLNSLMGRLDQSLNRSEDFIAEAAHRVRTPLATVRSYAEATLHRVDREENRHALRSMMRAIDEASRAAGQLLDHAMITFRADHLDRQPLDLGELVQDLVRGLTPVAEMKDLELRLHLPQPVTATATATATATGDAILLQNAVRNIIDNALKYAPGDSVVDITVRSGAVEICDQGPGFPPGEINSLAGRFKRGTNVKGIIGSGLGLTIAQDVATAHGGALTLSNRTEGGACVTLRL